MKPRQPSLPFLAALLLVAAPVLAEPTRTGTWSATEFIREMRSLGLKELRPDELVRLRIHGIDSDFVRSLSGGNETGDTRKKQ